MISMKCNDLMNSHERYSIVSKYCGSMKLIDVFLGVLGFETVVMDFPKCKKCRNYKRCSMNLDSVVSNHIYKLRLKND